MTENISVREQPCHGVQTHPSRLPDRVYSDLVQECWMTANTTALLTSIIFSLKPLLALAGSDIDTGTELTMVTGRSGWRDSRTMSR